MRPLVPAILVVAAAAVAGVSLAHAALHDDDRGRGQGAAPGQCVSAPLNTSKIIDSRTLYVDDYSGHAALLHMTTQCLNDRDEAIGIKFQGTSRICGPLDVDITDSVLTMPTPCLIDSVEPLDKDQARAYRNGK